jgi:hypothetical protein
MVRPARKRSIVLYNRPPARVFPAHMRVKEVNKQWFQKLKQQHTPLPIATST